MFNMTFIAFYDVLKTMFLCFWYFAQFLCSIFRLCWTVYFFSFLIYCSWIEFLFTTWFVLSHFHWIHSVQSWIWQHWNILLLICINNITDKYFILTNIKTFPSYLIFYHHQHNKKLSSDKMSDYFLLDLFLFHWQQTALTHCTVVCSNEDFNAKMSYDLSCFACVFFCSIIQTPIPNKKRINLSKWT